MMTILSFGAGQDSTAILYKLIYDPEFRREYAPDELIVVMADTGAEHPETVEHARSCERLCASRGIAFEYLTLDRGYHSGPWVGGLVGFYRAMNAIGSVAFPKTCSPNLKIEPIRRWLKDLIAHRLAGRPMGRLKTPAATARGGDRRVREYVAAHGKVRVLLGIAAGEEKRLGRPERLVWVKDCLQHEYPLVALGWDRAACQRYILSVSGTLPAPSA